MAVHNVMYEIETASTAGDDVTFFLGATTDKVLFDNSAGHLVFDNAELRMGDNDEIEFGDAADVAFSWDGTNLIIIPATDNTGSINIGNGTKDIDLKVFLGATTDICTFDVSAGHLVFDNAEIRMGDNDQIEFGDAGTTDSSIQWDGSNLIIDSSAAVILQIGAVGLLSYDDSAISSFAGATDVVGQDCFIETQDAGGTPTVARVGGLLNIKCGDGSAGATTVVSGAGGAVTVSSGGGGGQTGTAAGGASGAATFQSGAGGANTGGGSGGAGGAGGALAITGGVGGATDNTSSSNGGVGAAVTMASGAGGAASAGTGDGGAGGDITLTPGGGGTTSGGVVGAPGDVVISTGILRFAVQTIAMGDVAVTLTLVPGTPTGTTLTGNILYVDAESGTSENLLLPPEADCTGLQLTIENTGGETINVQNDAGGAVVTLETANVAIVTCDGTTWTGMVGVP